MKTRSFSVGEGKFKLEVVLVDTGRGVTVTVGSAAANCECEWCGVFVGRAPAGLHVNAEEISEVRHVPLDEIDGYLAGKPEHLAPWAKLALEDVSIRSALSAFARGEDRSRG